MNSGTAFEDEASGSDCVFSLGLCPGNLRNGRTPKGYYCLGVFFCFPRFRNGRQMLRPPF